MLRRSLPLFCAIGFLGFMACQTEDNPRPDIDVSESNLCSVIADVACYNMFRCCTGAQIEGALGLTQSTTVDECRRDVKLTCQDTLTPVFWSVARGATVINTNQYKNCLTAMTAPEAGCFLHQTEPPWRLQCDQVMFQGLLAVGLQCFYDHECQPNHFCGSDAICRALPSAGQPCPQYQCAASLFCSWDSGNCEALRTVGGACNTDSECQEGLYCGVGGTGSTCQARKALGVGCESDWECSSSYCIPGTCSNGDPCYADSQCGGTCSADGYSCYDDLDCSRSCNLTGYYCTTDLDCPDPGDSCPVNTCEGGCNGQPVCGEQYLVVDYCEDTIYDLL